MSNPNSNWTWGLERQDFKDRRKSAAGLLAPGGALTRGMTTANEGVWRALDFATTNPLRARPQGRSLGQVLGVSPHTATSSRATPPSTKLKPGAPTDPGRFNRLATKGASGPKGPQGPSPLSTAPELGRRPELPGSSSYDNSGYVSELGQVRANLAAQQARLEQGYSSRMAEIAKMFSLAETDQERNALRFAQTDLTNQAAAAKAGINAAWEQAAMGVDAARQDSITSTRESGDRVGDIYAEAVDNINNIAGPDGEGPEGEMAEAMELEGGARTIRDLMGDGAARERAFFEKLAAADAKRFDWMRASGERQQASQVGELDTMRAQQAAALGLNHYQRVNDRIEGDRRQMFQYQMDERNRYDSMSRALFDQLTGMDVQIAGERQRGIDRNFELGADRTNRQWELDYSDWTRQRDDRARFQQRERDAFQDFDIQSQLDQRSQAAMAEAMGTLPRSGQAFLSTLRGSAQKGGFMTFDGSIVPSPKGEGDVAVATAIVNVENAILQAQTSGASSPQMLRQVLASQLSQMDETHRRAFFAATGVYPTADALMAQLGMRG
jgi:hypothetical protein